MNRDQREAVGALAEEGRGVAVSVDVEFDLGSHLLADVWSLDRYSRPEFLGSVRIHLDGSVEPVS